MRIDAINYVEENGEINVAMAVYYEEILDGNQIDASCYSVQGRKIIGVYSNDRPRMNPTMTSREGKYVIIELSRDDADIATCTGEGSDRPRRMLPPNEVMQCRDIMSKNGKVIRAWTQPFTASYARDEAVDGFLSMAYYDEEIDESLMYRLFIPEDVRTGEKYPLVVFFHGGGESGKDDFSHLLRNQGASALATGEAQEKHPCFILAPKNTRNPMLQSVDPDTYELGRYVTDTIHLIWELMDKYNIDENRLYIIGQSMGSMNAWESNRNYPNMFAATINTVGQTSYEGIERLKDKPIWMFHAQNDDKAMPGCSDILDTMLYGGAKVSRQVWDARVRGREADELAKRQIREGANIMQTLWKEGTVDTEWVHVGGWQAAFSNEAVKDWLFSQINPDFSTEQVPYTVPCRNRPVRLDLGFSGQQVAQISCNGRHTLALLKDGSVWGWGLNCLGQAGNGTSGAFQKVSKPSQVKLPGPAVRVAAGNNFSICILEDGSMWGWGSNDCKQLACEDERLHFAFPIQIQGIEDVKDIGAGDGYAVALKKDGTVWSWGSNCSGQLANGTNRRTHIPVQAINPADPSGFLQRIDRITVGSRTVMGCTEEGVLYIWGDGEFGQLGDRHPRRPGHFGTCPVMPADPDQEPGVMRHVSGMAMARCFVNVVSEGQLYCWGTNQHGELGMESAPYVDTPVRHPLMRDVKHVACGMNHTLVLKKDGTVWSWGVNAVMSHGVTGVGDDNYVKRPAQLKELQNITDIFCGLNHAYAIQDDGTIWGWGNTNYDRLGPVMWQKENSGKKE